MEAFDLEQLMKARKEKGDLYLEFLRHPTLSVGLYEIAVGGVDPQTPHTEDEVYYVLKGRGMIQVGDEQRPVEAGSVIFVPALLSHRFHSIVEEISILVFFAPAEYTSA